MRICLPALSAAIAAMLLNGCGSRGDRIPGTPVPSFPLKITQESVDSSQVPPAVTWTASYDSAGVTFGIVLFLRDLPADSVYVLTQGYFMRKGGGDAGAFLRQLASTLGAASVPAPGAHQRADKLPIDAAITGTGLSRSPRTGYFTLQPPGNWICLKIFLAKGEGEFFLNADPVAGMGEIVRSAPGYGAAVVREMSRIVQ